METERIRKFEPLTRGIRFNDLRQRKCNALAYALGQSKLGAVVPKAFERVGHVVSDPFFGTSHATEELDSGIEQHRLSGTQSTLLTDGLDESRCDTLGEKEFIQLLVQGDSLPVTDTKVIPSGTCPSAKGSGSLYYLGQRLRESLTASDQRTVELEQLGVGTVALGQHQSIAPGEILEKTAVSEGVLVDRTPSKVVPNTSKLIKVTRENELDIWLVDLCP